MKISMKWEALNLETDQRYLEGDLNIMQWGTVSKLSTSLWLELRRGVFTCIGWQATLCDHIWQVTPRSSVVEFH